jgi:hypothetical protein
VSTVNNPKENTVPDFPSPYRLRQRVEPPVPDAPGYDLKPNPATATSPAEFVRALRDLRAWAGYPSYRELSRRCGRSPSPTTFQHMLTTDALPERLDLVVAFVAALGLSADREQWTAAWRRLAVLGHRDATS